MGKIVHNIARLGEAIGLSSAGRKESEILALIAKSFYQATEYGVSVHQTKACHEKEMDEERIWAIGVSSIVEGTDIEIPEVVLQFPFNTDELYKVAEQVDEAARDAHAEWSAQSYPFEE